MTKTNESSEQPRVVEVESMDEILGTSASVTMSGDGSKPQFFSKDDSDVSFLDKPGEAENETEAGNDDDNQDLPPETGSDADIDKPTEVESLSKDEIDQIAGVNNTEEEEEEESAESENKSGRKPALIETMNKLIKSGSIELFEDEQDISKYTNDDIVELIEANIKQRVEETAKSAPLDVFKRLDPKVQDIIAFQLNGGKDVTSVLKAVAQSQEVTELSLDKEVDQERIVREWLRASNVMNNEEIEDEIASIIDRGDLQKKAEIFKPKLDDKQAIIVKKKLDEQEKAKERADQAREVWSQTIFDSLNKPTLNGIPLSNKVQTMLFHGLTDNSNYQDRHGNPTNALGHFIEEHQHGENGNPSVLLEALWLMSNPVQYRQHVLSLGQKETHTETFRKLKTAEGERKTSSSKQGEQSRTPSRKPSSKKGTGKRKFFTR